MITIGYNFQKYLHLTIPDTKGQMVNCMTQISGFANVSYKTGELLKELGVNKFISNIKLKQFKYI